MAERRRAQPSTATGAPLLLLGAVAATVAWVDLVGVAINLGHAAAAGDGAPAWVATVAVGVAATVCLLAAFVLLGRLRAQVQSKSPAGQHRR